MSAEDHGAPAGAAHPARERPRPATPWRPVLLSGLVFPGLGQMASGHLARGLVFGLGTVTVLVLVLRRVARETLVRLPDDPSIIDPLFPFRLAHEIHADNAAFFVRLTLVLVALWVGSILDAWWTARAAIAGARGPRPSSAHRR